MITVFNISFHVGLVFTHGLLRELRRCFTDTSVSFLFYFVFCRLFFFQSLYTSKTLLYFTLSVSDKNIDLALRQCKWCWAHVNCRAKYLLVYFFLNNFFTVTAYSFFIIFFLNIYNTDMYCSILHVTFGFKFLNGRENSLIYFKAKYTPKSKGNKMTACVVSFVFHL